MERHVQRGVYARTACGNGKRSIQAFTRVNSATFADYPLGVCVVALTPNQQVANKGQLPCANGNEVQKPTEGGEEIPANTLIAGFDETQVSEDAPHLHACLRDYGQTDGRGDVPDQWYDTLLQTRGKRCGRDLLIVGWEGGPG
jgi:hypothetical protein